ncbi:unnamed protein product [Paramecium octaurelia]|uniref:Uncharacterized protein n=1 Tax=Paramecium octaurelia TaxID=43137 RepID=A0A8S1SLR4_PAROT|nr:unnamed protein product [Paramecium octaurelia]
MESMMMPYKKRILKATTLFLTCTFILILDMFFKEPLQAFEVSALIAIQDGMGLKGHIIESIPFFLLANIQEQYVFLLITMHVLSAIYFLHDRFIAIKCMFVLYFGWYFLMLLQMIYNLPQPFWVDSDIDTYFCDQKYGGPGDSIYLPAIFIFTLLYYNQCQLKAYIIASASLLFYCFAVYISAQVFLMDLVLGFVYFMLFYAFVINYDKKITTLIKSKDTDKLFGMKVLGVVSFLFIIALIYYTLKDYTDSIQWITNYFTCYMRQFTVGDYQHYRFNTILGLEPTFCQITILICLVVMGFIHLPKNKATQKQFIIIQLAFIPGWLIMFLQGFVTEIDVLHRMGLSQLIIESLIFGLMHWWIFGFVGVKATKSIVTDEYLLLE